MSGRGFPSLSRAKRRPAPTGLAGLGLVAILLLACRVLGTGLATPEEQLPQATAAGATPIVITAQVTASQSASPQPAGHPTGPPTWTASPAQTAACLPVQEGVQLQAADFSSLPQAVLDFLNQGGSPQQLDQALYQAGFASLPVPVEAADMTGDGLQEVVAAVYDPGSTQIPPAGSLLIYECKAGQYRLALQADSPQGFGAPSLRYLLDIDADGRAELVTSLPTCGASSCFEDVRIYAWDGVRFSNRLQGDSSDLPYPDIRLVDQDGDRIFDLELAGGAFGSVGAGPQRGLSRRWPFDPVTSTWREPVDEVQTSPYRIHVLLDADRATQEGDYGQALAAYLRVADDTELVDWMDPPAEQANLGAYALFKAAVIQQVLQQQDQAAATFDLQVARYLPGNPGYAYVQLAQAYQAASQAGGVSAGCAAARRFAAEHQQQILEPLSSQTFGYANPDLSPREICPWEE